jgi:integrase/recombinase XerD
MSEANTSPVNYLKANEMLRVLAEAKRVSTRNWCLVLFAFRFGLRASELAGLTLDNVKGGVLDVQRLKGSQRTKDEIVSDPNPLLDAKKALAAWLRVRPQSSDNSLFLSRLGKGMKRRAVYELFEDAAFHAGIEGGRRNPHIAKHTLGVTLRKAGVDLATIASALGHSDPATTIRYYQHVDRDEVRTAVSGAFAQIGAA